MTFCYKPSLFAVINISTNKNELTKYLCNILCMYVFEQDEKGSGELHLLLNTVFLIAACCERGSRTAQSLAQELFNLPELLW